MRWLVKEAGDVSKLARKTGLSITAVRNYCVAATNETSVNGNRRVIGSFTLTNPDLVTYQYRLLTLSAYLPRSGEQTC